MIFSDVNPMKLKMDDTGAIRLPRKLRKKLGFEPGMKLQIKIENQTLSIFPANSEQMIVEEQGLLVYPGIPEETLEKNTNKNRNKRNEKIQPFQTNEISKS